VGDSGVARGVLSEESPRNQENSRGWCRSRGGEATSAGALWSIRDGW
jgi:hypothetical protein